MKGSVLLKTSMKRLLGLLLAVMMIVTTITATAATLDLTSSGNGTTVTLYYCYKGTVPSGHTIKANACQSNNENLWVQQEMKDTGSTYEGYKVYTAKVTERYGGFDQLQFQLYDGSNWKSQEVAFSSWTTVDKINGKMYYAGKWLNYSPTQNTTAQQTTSKQESTTSASTGGKVTYYFENTNTWSDVYAYVWKDGSSNEADWPGTKAAFVENSTNGKKIYSYTIDKSKYDMVIFNGGNGQPQTVNIKLSDYSSYNAFKLTGDKEGNNYKVAGWNYKAETTESSSSAATSSSTTETPTTASSEASSSSSSSSQATSSSIEESSSSSVSSGKTVSLDVTAIKTEDARYAIYLFNDEKNIWVNMTLKSGNVYTAEIPAGYSNLIFCRMNGKTTVNSFDNCWNQTEDLTLGGNLYTITGWGDGMGAKLPGKWSTVQDESSSTKPESSSTSQPTSSSQQSTTAATSGKTTYYFTNNKGWSKVNAYVWNKSSDNKEAEWPGTAATYVENNDMGEAVYSYTIDRNKYDSVIFNDGSSQTVDITLANYTTNGFYLLDTKDSQGHYNVGTWSYGGDTPIPGGTKENAFKNAMWVDTQPSIEDTTTALVKMYVGSSSNRLYLPSGVDTKKLTIYHSFNSFKIAGTTIESGKTYDATGWTNTTCTVNGTSKSFKIYQSTARSFFMTTGKDLPTAPNPALTSKGSVKETDGLYMAFKPDGTLINEDTALAQIKGRGNSSWEASYKYFGKYAYNIKLGKKAKLADGATSSKKWCLLANNADEAAMRNTVVYNLGDSIGLEDSPLSDIYDVYNNGNYLGTYQIAEKVEVGKNALVQGTSIDDLNEEANTDANGVVSSGYENYGRAYQGGSSINESSSKGFYKYCTGFTTPANFKEGDFLLEFELDERFPDEVCGFISNMGQQVVLKTPEVASKAEVEYIMDRFNAAEAVAYAQSGANVGSLARGTLTKSNGSYTYKSNVSDYTVTVSGYDKLIDTESFAQNYLIQEYVENLDGVSTSFYVNLKNEESVFTASPLWDFDWTMGQYSGDKYAVTNSTQTLNPSNTNQWFIKNKGIYIKDKVSVTDNIVTKLCKIGDFWTGVQLQWKYNVYPQIQKLYGSNGLIKTTYSEKIRASITMNEDRYHFIANDPILSWGSTNTGNTWDAAVNSLNSWASSRAAWMNSNIGSPSEVNIASGKTSIVLKADKTNSTITATATPSGVTVGGKALAANGFTYVFTVSDGKNDTVVTQIGNNVLTFKKAEGVASYTVTVVAYPTISGKDTGFVLPAASETYTVPTTGYTVKFVMDDGTVISEAKYAEDEAVTVPANPTKEATKQYTYTFAGWDQTVSETAVADATYVAIFNATVNKYAVTVTAENGTVTGCPSEKVEYGTAVTLVAKAPEGYTFKGFYKNNILASSSSTYSFKVEDTTDLEARFIKNKGAELSVSVLGGTGLKVKIGADGTESKQKANYKNGNVATGQYVTLTPIGISGYVFRHWTNQNGKIISYKESYTFMFNANTSIIAVYSDTLGGEVTFVSGYNQINSSMCYGSADEIEIPEPYSKTGYVFKFWTIDGTTEATAEQIYEASVTENVTVKAVYEAEKVYYNINITDGSIVSVDDDKTDAGKTSGSYISAAAIRVIANEAPVGKKFAYWKNQKGEIITYAKECYVYLMEDTTLTAVYVDEAEAIDAKAVASISSITLDETTNKMKVIANLSVPEGCTVITAGLVATDDATVGTDADAFNSANAKYFKSQNIEDQNVVNCRYTWTKSNVTVGDIWYLRGYVTYKDANGNIYEVYGDIVTNEALFG